MRTFETQGMIYRRQGSGTFVIHPSQIFESGLEVLESIDTLAKRINLPISVSEIKVDHRRANDEEVQALSLPPGAQVIWLKRIILVEQHPIAYLVDILPDEILNRTELESKFSGSVLDLLIQRGTPSLSSSRCEINAVPAPTEVSRALHIQRGDVLLRFVAYLYTAAGRVIDYSFSYFIPGYFKFHVFRRIGEQKL
jgi:GntR family transcriptional regulator